MSFEEKSQWSYGIAAFVVPTIYAIWLFGQIGSADAVQDIEYVRTLLWAIGGGILVNIVGSMFIRGANPKDADKRDERDKHIGRLGDQVSFIVFSVLVLAPFTLALLDQPTFWIANSIYFAYALTALVGADVKAIAYRKGA